ncbi:MAG TPA: CoA transferase [Eoetvoesiella sp.]
MSDQPFLPLSGIRIIDFSHVIAGPLATFYLAQMGADVVKIEKPGGGDVLRRSERGASAFLSLNAGKQSRELDFHTKQGLEEAVELAREADVFVDNFRPGSLERYGLGYEAVRAVNPRIIYCSISGFGRSGPWSDRPAYDHVVQAMTGMAMTGGREGDSPIKTGFPVIDAATGMLGALSIVSAIHQRNRDGASILLDVSMAAASMHLMYTYSVEALTKGVSPSRVGNQGYSGSPAADFFKAKDGWIALAANTPKQFNGLLEVLGLQEVASDPEIFDKPADNEGPVSFLRARDPARLKAVLKQRIEAMDAMELETALVGAGVPAAKVRTIGEFVADAAPADVLGTFSLAEHGAHAITPGLGFRVVG